MPDHDPAEDRERTTSIEPRSATRTATALPAAQGGRGMALFGPGTVVAGRYRVAALVGRGGMGAVYRADDLVLGQAALERLTDEVRIGRRITHPNVCRLHDIVCAEGQRFLVMEFVDGEDLSSLLRRLGTLPHERALAIARDLAAGLLAAHAEGIVHRDLKPGNVMIDGRGRARITDFGLAVFASAAGERPEIAGTPAYMAPEQLKGQAVDARTDLYALGLILCELLAGQRLNEGRSMAEIAAAPAPVPASLAGWAPQIDPALERVILRSLDPNPERRPGSAAELLALLPGSDPLAQALSAGETPTPEMVAAAARSGTLRRPVALATVGAIVALLLLEAALAQRTRLYALSEVHPDTLRARARDVAGRLAPDLRAQGEAWWFERDLDVLRSPGFRAARTWEEVRSLDPGPVCFVLRQGKAPLVARNAADSISNMYILQSGRVTRDDPPLAPGMVTVVLDAHGRLRYAETMTREGERRAEPTASRAHPTPRPPSTLSQIASAVQILFMFASLAVAVVFARRHRRSGRGDARGATRVAVYAFASLVLWWVLAADHVLVAEAEARLFSVAFGAAVSAAVVLWFFYLALEPFVRRRLPEALVSWSRLLNGRLRDSLVARDLLVGLLGGVAGRLLLDAALLAPALWGGGVRSLSALQAIGPARKALGNVCLLQVDAIEIGIGSVFLLVFLQRAVRRTWIAALLCLAVFMGMGASIATPAMYLYLVLLLVILLRCGLLATVATYLVESILTYTSLTLDPSAWYFGRSLAALATLAAAGAWLGWLTTRPALGHPILARPQGPVMAAAGGAAP